MRNILFLILSLLTIAAYGQSARFHTWADTTREAGVATALAHFNQGDFKPLDPPYLNPGFTESIHWIALQPSANVADMLLILDNAHINHLEWFAVTDSIRQLAVTGDFHPFRQRPVIHNTFAFPLEPGAPLYLLKVDKTFESLQAPLSVISRQELQELASGETLVNGILTGIVILIVLFGIFLFINTREAVYGWYALYALSIICWIWANKGMGFHYLWPDSCYFPSRSRLTFALSNLIIGVQFLDAFVGLRDLKILHRIMRVFQVIWFGMLGCILWPMDYTVFNRYSMALQFMIPVFTLLAVASILIALFIKARRGNLPAKIYILATVVLLFFIILESLYHLGSVKLPGFFAHFGMFTGVVLEMIIITFGLAARFNYYRKEKENIQRTLTDTIITVEEEQRKTIADTLHDEIGSMLSLASLHLGAAKENPVQSEAKIEQATGLLLTVSQTIRNISHQLTPVAIEKYGLSHAISDMVQIANNTGKIHIELIVVGFNNVQYPFNYQHTVYRIVQELLQNILKHAAAVNVLVQLVELEDSCTIMVEDNGTGIQPEDAIKPGFLRSIRSKVDYLQGHMEIDARPNEGAIINIELPLPKKITH